MSLKVNLAIGIACGINLLAIFFLIQGVALTGVVSITAQLSPFRTKQHLRAILQQCFNDIGSENGCLKIVSETSSMRHTSSGHASFYSLATAVIRGYFMFFNNVSNSSGISGSLAALTTATSGSLMSMLAKDVFPLSTVGKMLSGIRLGIG